MIIVIILFYYNAHIRIFCLLLDLTDDNVNNLLGYFVQCSIYCGINHYPVRYGKCSIA